MKKLCSGGLMSIIIMSLAVMLGSCNYNDAVTAGTTASLEELADMLRQQNYKFSGMVYNQNGKPVTNARVAAYKLKGSEWEYTSLTTTNEGGGFQLEVDRDSLAWKVRLEVLTDEPELGVQWISAGDAVEYDIKDLMGVQAYDFHVQVENLNVDPTPDDPVENPDFMYSSDMKQNADGYFIASMMRYNQVPGNKKACVKVDMLSKYDKETFQRLFVNAYEEPVTDALLTVSSVYTIGQAETEVSNRDDDFMTRGVRKGAEPKYDEIFMYGLSVKFNKGYILQDHDFDEFSVRFHLDAISKDCVLRRLVDKEWEDVPKSMYRFELDEMGESSILAFTPDRAGVYALFTTCVSLDSESKLEETVRAKIENRPPAGYPDEPGTIKVIPYIDYMHTLGNSYDIKAGGNIAQALLLEYLCITYGNATAQFANRFNMNDYKLYPGFAIVLTGWQTITNRTFALTDLKSSCAITMTKYGAITFSIAGYTWDHNGGSF